MRFRIYKRKVLLLALIMLVAAFAFWSGGKQRKNEAFPRNDETSRNGQAGNGNPTRKVSNESQPSKFERPEVDNLTLTYRGIVYQLNFDQTVRNQETIKTRPPNDLVVVVQVHNRPEYLQILVNSLRKVKGIENVLLIFSHDFWSPEINHILAGIDFCQVLQIFFPFSIQLYPNEFPGHDPRDCPRDISKTNAFKLGCINAEYPDSFGHYRESKFCQTKHHWWWKLHFVWERVKVLKGHKGLVLFIEEDHYLSPDFYHVLKNMWRLKTESCPDCDILSLGTYTRVSDFTDKTNKVEVKTWRSTEHNMGMAMTRDTYQKMIECTDTFCEYDDYNWDWTLQYLTVSCLPQYWKVMVCEASRIFHAGDCGMHHKKACMPSVEISKIDRIINSNVQHLFPETMIISKIYPLAALTPHVKNGGWGDIRDHELCASYRRLQ
ncbi:alpha-1,6-mannosyl-glycoprotein 2-beta-N-acetylglucosaminyltransferase [Heterodontus francisci]|uniref:alpha-1,6-mannosyl-glycoprotein 2-beta-N-acetylglucosaminyltransferase n=1 Tax=Heterodontus francisci TaxID=7792 RepID=UPI00355AE2C7